MIELRFTRSHTPVGSAIRALTFSEWDHVEFVIDRARVLSAWGSRGVAVRPLYRVHREARAMFEGPEAIVESALAQKGKPYDFWALIGWPFHRNWQSTDAWFCSEFVAAMAARHGVHLVPRTRHHRVTPGMVARANLLTWVE